MTIISNKVKIILFTEDRDCIFKSDNIIDLEHIMQDYLDILHEWLCLNKLSINIQKSTEILFNIRNLRSSITYYY